MDGQHEEEGVPQQAGRGKVVKWQEHGAGGPWGLVRLAAELGPSEPRLGRELLGRGKWRVSASWCKWRLLSSVR